MENRMSDKTKTPAYEVRNAQIRHCQAIQKLLDSKTAHSFGQVKHQSISARFTEYQTLRLILKLKHEVLAYTEVRAFPDLEALPTDCWLNLIMHHYCLLDNLKIPITLSNTLFINFLIYDGTLCWNVILILLREIFYRTPKLRYLINIKPPYTAEQLTSPHRDYSILNRFAKVYYPYDFNGTTMKTTQTLNIINRSNVINEVEFRLALAEDNDDVVEIIDFEEPEIRERLGDFYIAEEVLRLDDEAKNQTLIIGETNTHNVGHVTTGFLWLTKSIDIKFMIKNYDLESFGNLLRCTVNRPHNQICLKVRSAEFKPPIKLFTDAALSELEETFILGGLMQDNSLTSVVSSSKVQIKSKSGYLENDIDSYYERERVFTKFRHVYEDLRKAKHYFDMRLKTIALTFDIKDPLTPEITKLDDAANVFMLHKLALHPRQRFQVAFSYLCAAFCAYPNRDYCLLSISPDTKKTDSVSELLKYFLRLNQRPGCPSPDDIYITHRCSLFSDLNVFELTQSDVEYVKNSISYNLFTRSTVDSVVPATNEAMYATQFFQKRVVNELLEDYLRNAISEFKILTICCGHSRNREENTFVGFVVLRQFCDYDSITKQFMLPTDEVRNKTKSAEIIMLKLHPLFHIWTDEIFRTIACKTNFWEFFYMCHSESLSLPNDILKNMMPVEPHRLKKNLFIDLNNNQYYRKSSHNVSIPPLNCVLEYFTVYRHNLLPMKFFGNEDAIVIIGFSEVCKAFLRLLVFDWNDINFTNSKVYNCVPNLNVTVISSPGVIEAEYDTEFACRYCINGNNCYIGTYNNAPFVCDCTHRLDLRQWVHFVTGDIKSIEREAKIVQLLNGCNIRYDTLLVMCDTNYGLKTRSSPNRTLPYNYVQINRRIDKIILYHKVQEIREDNIMNANVIVYGANIATFECINFITSHGINPSDIILVVPPKTADTELNDPTTDERIEIILLQMCRDMGLNIYESTLYKNWNRFQNENIIAFVNFRHVPSGELFSIKCDLFINFAVNYMDIYIENVLKKSGIDISNKSILVDEKYKTNDDHIYAMGKFITLRDKPNFQYIYTNEHEAAEKLMHILKLTKSQKLIERKYNRPRLFVAHLPLEFVFTKVTMPKRFVKYQTAKSSMETMSTFDNSSFCRIRLNEYRVVEEIVALEKMTRTNPYHLEYFCGKHETLLNGLYLRWCRGLIRDFLKFFNEPWTELLMHERFEELQSTNKASVMRLLQAKGAMKENAKLPDRRIAESTEFVLETKKVLEENLITFLKNHRVEFSNDFAEPVTTNFFA